MTIREATVKDVDRIHDLGKDVDEFKTTDEVVTFWPKHILRNCIQSPNDWLIVAEDEGELLGFTIVNNSPVFKKAVVENIFVLPKHQNKGIGQKLIAAAMDRIKKAGCEYVCILARENNDAAIDFYVKNGFNRGRNFVWLDKVLSKKLIKKFPN